MHPVQVPGLVPDDRFQCLVGPDDDTVRERTATPWGASANRRSARTLAAIMARSRPLPAHVACLDEDAGTVELGRQCPHRDLVLGSRDRAEHLGRDLLAVERPRDRVGQHREVLRLE